jgi:hypothetical protein
LKVVSQAILFWEGMCGIRAKSEERKSMLAVVECFYEAEREVKTAQ